jgi:hypothetical protein
MISTEHRVEGEPRAAVVGVARRITTDFDAPIVITLFVPLTLAASRIDEAEVKVNVEVLAADSVGTKVEVEGVAVVQVEVELGSR